MGWDRRRYYTRKVRRGRKVTSQYVGRGPTAELAAAAAAERQARLAAERAALAEATATATSCRLELELLVRLETLAIEINLGDKIRLRRGEWERRRDHDP